jgi:hypothetical protein
MKCSQVEMRKVRRVLFGIVVISALVAALAPTSALGAGTESSSHGTFGWVVGATTPFATATAPDGSSISMKGKGSLTAGPGSMASGGGTYMKSNGETGTWRATGLDSFVSYGTSTIAAVPGATGGEAKLRISLSNGQSGTLTIICVAPGSQPPPSRMEGIQVILGAGASGEYTMETHGNTVFIAS